jgi:hypothetical protein
MSRHRAKFYFDLERNFPNQYNQSLPLNDIKDYVKHKFPSLEVAKGYTDKQTQKEFFGPFYKENVDIPIYDKMVCMQFSGLYPNLWLDFQRKKIEETKVRNLDILLDISGIGKTFNILGTGTKQYLILCSCVGQSSDSQMKDNSFLKLIEEINHKRGNPGELISETPRLIYSFLFLRLMHLWLLLEQYPNELTPTQYILNQLNGSNLEMNELCKDIDSYLNKNHLSKDVLYKYCYMLVKEIKNKTGIPIGFALDEASAAEKSTKDLFYSWRGNKRGMLPILLESLFKLDFNYLVFAGTNYSFAQAAQLSSTTAKQGSLITKIVTDFEIIPSIKDYLALHLDVSGCENIFNDHFLMMMSNHTRGRFGGNLIFQISDIYRKNSNLSKEEILRKAIIQTYQHYVNQIYDQLVKIHNQENSKETIRLLIDLYGFSKCDKTEEFSIYDERLMDIGIAKIKLKENNISFTYIDECSVIEAIDKFLQQYYSLDVIHSYVIQNIKDNSGFTIELIYFSILCSRRYNGKFLKDLPIFVGSKIKLPEWTNNFKWEVEMKSIVNFNDSDYFNNLDEMNAKIVRLPTDFHGDIFILWKWEAKYYYFNLSSKFYSKLVPLKDHLKSQCSTDISNAYFDNYILKDKLSLNEHQDGEIIDTEFGEENKSKNQQKGERKVTSEHKKEREIIQF